METNSVGKQIALLRKELQMTQETLAERLGVTYQAVSKWENGHSLPESALLPALAQLLGCSIDELFGQGELTILEAHYGDGLEASNVTRRLGRLIEGNELNITIVDSLLGTVPQGGRACHLTVKYQTPSGTGYAVGKEGETLSLSPDTAGVELPDDGLVILRGSYGTRKHHYDVMHKIEHYRAFHWDAYRADHETFPSDPANDDTEYLTLVYANREGLHMATCAEGESLAYSGGREHLVRRQKGGQVFLRGVVPLPSFGAGWECSWAAALTAALLAMGEKTTYDEVMGVSGACYRLAFCSPGWDYSSVDGLVACDYATPGYAAFGYTPEMHAHIEKGERAGHRARIMRELRGDMPVLGINLRVAPEWGVICGYGKEGEDLFCRTKYDQLTVENDPAFMQGRPAFTTDQLGPNGYLLVDNWPFLLCYFTGRRARPSAKDNLLASLKTFADCAAKTQEGGYAVGFHAYEVWARDLRDDGFYAGCDGEQMARRFSVDQFCALSLHDARRAAHAYLSSSGGLLSGKQGELLGEIAELFRSLADKGLAMHRMLDSGAELDGEGARRFWTRELRHAQAQMLDEMAKMEREAAEVAGAILA